MAYDPLKLVTQAVSQAGDALDLWTHTPRTARKTVELWTAAGLPHGALNLVEGGPEIGRALGTHAWVDGVFFTGSFEVGREINRLLADTPGKIAALEMGGNNTLVVHK